MSTSRAILRNSWTSSRGPSCGSSSHSARRTCSRLKITYGSTARSVSIRSGRLVDDQVAHAGAAITQVATADHALEMLQPVPCGGALRQRQTRSDVEPEAILPLPDELEVDASVSVQESR